MTSLYTTFLCEFSLGDTFTVWFTEVKYSTPTPAPHLSRMNWTRIKTVNDHKTRERPKPKSQQSKIARTNLCPGTRTQNRQPTGRY